MQISNQFGIEISSDVVRRILNKFYKSNPNNNNDPGWLTFLGHTKDSLWSIDLFRTESINLQSHWIMVMMDPFTRRVMGFAAHKGDVDGLTLCCMFNKIISNRSLPKRLSSDNDPFFTISEMAS